MSGWPGKSGSLAMIGMQRQSPLSSVLQPVYELYCMIEWKSYLERWRSSAGSKGVIMVGSEEQHSNVRR